MPAGSRTALLHPVDCRKRRASSARRLFLWWWQFCDKCAATTEIRNPSEWETAAKCRSVENYSLQEVGKKSPGLFSSLAKSDGGIPRIWFCLSPRMRSARLSDGAAAANLPGAFWIAPPPDRSIRSHGAHDEAKDLSGGIRRAATLLSTKVNSASPLTTPSQPPTNIAPPTGKSAFARTKAKKGTGGRYDITRSCRRLRAWLSAECFEFGSGTD